MPSKKTAGAFIGVMAVVALLIYVYNVKPAVSKTGAHPRPNVGRGYGTTPYGSPSGNPGALRGLGKEGCGCHSSGDIHV